MPRKTSVPAAPGTPAPGIAEARQAPRLKLPAMYTLVRVRPMGREKYIWTGFIYDVSDTGMRIELDCDLDPGTQVEVRAMLPGARQTTIHATGHIVRRHDDHDEPGPVRMGLEFDSFNHADDRMRLSAYLANSGLAA
ncbi:MAG: PilZ domain-containing protein [Planctomycetota bacterium]|nr:PilZ domain-containing protein [Planctomycetota bacterium]